MRTRLSALFNVLQEADVAPTTQATVAVPELEQQIAGVMQQWEAIKSQDIPALNNQLRGASLTEVKLTADTTD